MALSATLILAKAFTDPWEAYLLQGRLTAEGVPAFVFNDQHVYIKWSLSTALGGVRVMVPAHLAGEAQAVWEGVVDGDYQALLAGLFGGIEEARCPKCGATNIKRGATLHELVFAFIVLFLTGVPLKLARTRCTCRVCGTMWNED